MLHELLEELKKRENGGNDILPEAAIARLLEALPRFQTENPWKPGDVVTVREDAPIKGAGRPRIVVRVGENLSRAVPEHGEWSDGVAFNVETIGIPDGENIVPHLVPHWALERYEAEVAKAA